MVPLCLNGETLHIQRVATHLGHLLGIDNVNFIAKRNATRDFIWKTNYVMACHFTNHYHKVKMSVLFSM